MSTDAFTEWFFEGKNLLAIAQVVAAFITAAATFALWRVTRILAAETSALARMTARPFVVCGLEPSPLNPNNLNLMLRNTGNAIAFDIKVKMTPALPKVKTAPPLPEANDQDSNGSRFEISLLPPGQALPRAAAQSPDIPEETIFSFDVSWSLSPNSPDREKLNYAYKASDGFWNGFNENSLKQIAQELEKIRRQFVKS